MRRVFPCRRGVDRSSRVTCLKIGDARPERVVLGYRGRNLCFIDAVSCDSLDCLASCICEVVDARGELGTLAVPCGDHLLDLGVQLGKLASGA